jgi:catechol 2,3-dioxygenase
MDVLFDVGSALFMSYDGYHHHIGANIWGGRVPPPADALGLDHFVLYMHSADQLAQVRAQLDAIHAPYEADGTGVVVTDPSGNRIRLVNLG